MAFGFTDLTPEGKRYFQELKKLTELEVHVGFQAADIAEIAAYNEYGGSNRPARPFMQQSFENHEGELQQACDAVNRTINKGGTAEQGLKQLGTFTKGLIQDEIASGGFAPNAPSTIKTKGSAQPLIDTGTMRQSVNFEIKKR